MPELRCEETLSEVPVKLATMQPSPATLFHRMVQRRLTQGQAAPGHRARRRLFSAVDPDEVSRFVKRELACIRAADRRRYNFDFDKMLPLDGRFQWERVGAALTPCENTPSPLLHRSARRLELNCPRSEAASCHGELRSGDTDTKTSAAPPVTCPGKDRVGCLLNGDAPSQTLNETSQSRRGPSQDSCLHSSSAGGKLATTRLRQTALTDLWQTRKRSGVWEAAENQSTKRARTSLLTAPLEPPTAGHSADGRPGTHVRPAVLGPLQGQSVVPS